MSRRASAEHPLLFIDATDIPPAPLIVRPPTPRANESLSPFRALLAAAETSPLAELDDRHIGRSVLVGGERRAREGLMTADALLDDGTAVMPLVLSARASRTIRAALSGRFVLVSGTVRDVDGSLHIEPDEIADLRALAREWPGPR
ncbi:MAG: hypothetical protein C0444_02505 [Microbacterium sp.]|nr:hypothetical protein [Microbacterium sp.]MBA4345391.1 hypothetical protein [Microbacterium sp.]